MTIYNTGMTMKEKIYEIQRQCVPLLSKYMEQGEWQNFIDLALTHWEVMAIAFQFYSEVPDSLKYQFAIDAYINHGDSIPAVRKAVRNAWKYGKAVLPPEIANEQAITIYRAGEEPIEKAKYRISWTADYKIAEFFLTEYIGRHATHLYSGKIKTADIIAYCDEREEREIMQYGKVFDIVEITPPQASLMHGHAPDSSDEDTPEA